MSIDSITNADMFKGFASIITGGAFVGWYREHRKGRKDAYGFAIEMIGQLSARVDALVMEIAQVKAENTLAADSLTILRKQYDELKVENTRLKTALGEHRRGEVNHEAA